MPVTVESAHACVFVLPPSISTRMFWSRNDEAGIYLIQKFMVFATVKAQLANGPNICFNILSILLNGSHVESVCHSLSTELKRVQTMLNRCWKSLKAFKLSFNIHSTFRLLSGMFGMLKRNWSHLPRSFNIVEQAHAQLRRGNHGHHGCKDDSKAKQSCTWLWYVQATAFKSVDPTMEDYETPDDFAEEFEASTRKSKEPEAGKTKKNQNESPTR